MRLKSHALKVAPWIFVLGIAMNAGAESCWNMDFDGVTTTRYDSIHKQQIHGTVTYSGRAAMVRGVKVCGGGSCTLAASSMRKGDTAEFLLTVENLNPATLTVECSESN
jgi:hypothetical protein